MRRPTTLLVLVLALLAGACTDDPATETVLADDPPPSSSTTDGPVSTSTTAAPASTAPPSTTAAPSSTTSVTEPPVTSTTAPPLGMCGELIPVVTDDGTLCLTPEQAEWGVGVDPFWEGQLPPMMVVGDLGSLTELRPNDTGGLDEIALGTLDGWVVEVRAATDGSLVVQRHLGDEEYWAEVVIVRSDGTEEIVPRAVSLFDVAVVEGQEVVLVADIPWTHDSSVEVVEARLLSDPATVVFDLGPASGDFFEVEHAAVRGPLGVVGGYVDDTEFIELAPVIGDPALLADPLVDLLPNRPPRATAVTLSPDGTSVTWAEGPDFDGELGEWVDQDWVIRSVDAMTGEEQLWWPVDEPEGVTGELWVASIHDLGSFIIVNRTGWEGEVWVSYPALVIDFTVEEPETWELPVSGLVAPVPVVG